MAATADDCTNLRFPASQLAVQLGAVGLLCGILALSVGCRATSRAWSQRDLSGRLPAKHSVRTAGFVVLSDFRIEDDSSIIRELELLQQQISESLHLPSQRDSVVVYLFSGESEYRRYMRQTWPALPPRRAYFIGTSRELAVYSFHGPNVEEDLRHELTHGLLHASLKSVPLWLDEGLAEYFEVRGATPGEPHKDHVRILRRAFSSGWRPSLQELEQLTDFQNMTQREYAESWAWVHFMLHDASEERMQLQQYLAQLRDSDVPRPFFEERELNSSHSAVRMTAWVNEMASESRPGFLRL